MDIVEALQVRRARNKRSPRLQSETNDSRQDRLSEKPAERLLSEQREALPSDHRAVLDAIWSATALLDSDGMIVFVNEAWHQWTTGLLAGPHFGVGQDYPALCELIVGEEAVDGAAIAAGIRKVLLGELECLDLNYLCPSVSSHSEFILRVTPLSRSRLEGAVVMQLDLGEWQPPPDPLRSGEKSYRQIFQLHPRPMWVYGKKSLRFLSVNQAAIRHYGYSEAEFLSMTARDIWPAEDVAAFEQFVADGIDVTAAGVWRHVKRDGTIFPAEIASHTIDFESDEPARLVMAIDVTERVKAERELARISRAQRMLSRCTKVLVHVRDELELLREICRISVEMGGYSLAWVGFLEGEDYDSCVPVAFAGEAESYLRGFAESWNKEKFSGSRPALECVRTGQVVAVQDFQNDDRFQVFGDFARSFGIQSAVCIPLLQNGRAFGVFGQYSPDLLEFPSQEIAVLQELATNLSFGIAQMRERARQTKLEALLVRVATAVSATSGAELFEELALNMAEALGAQAGLVVELLDKEPATARSIAVAARGKIVANFEYEIAGMPCESLGEADDNVIPDRLQELYPNFSIGGVETQASVGRRLYNSAGDPIGLLVLLFEERIDEPEFILSAIRIFAARAAAELEREFNVARYREQASILERTKDAMILQTLDQRVVYWNQGAQKLYGWSYEEVVGKNIGEVLYVYPPALAEVSATVMAEGEWRGQLAHRHRDGELVTVEAHWTLLYDKNGNPESISSVATDITQKLLLEDRLRHSQKMDAIGQLTGGIAHDFNNILTVILGATTLLSDHVRHSEKGRLLLQMTERAALRGGELTTQMLAFSRRQELQPKILSIGPLLDDMVRLVRGAIGEDVDVKLVKSPDLGAARIDPGQLQSALLNLCLNSRDAMPDGGSIIIEARNVQVNQSQASLNPGLSAGSYIAIEVTDTGVGIPLENRDRVFDPFFTTKEVGKGTGLGLSMVYGFVKQSNGYINIYSEVNFGTSIKIYIPSVALPEQPEAPASLIIEDMRGKETILVVEDDTSVLQLAIDHLQALGYTVLAATKGDDALEMISRHPEIDLLFTDIVLPGGMNGCQLADEAVKMFPKLKVLYASGYSENAIYERLAQGGHLLNKPYRANDLSTKLRLVISRRD